MCQGGAAHAPTHRLHPPLADALQVQSRDIVVQFALGAGALLLQSLNFGARLLDLALLLRQLLHILAVQVGVAIQRTHVLANPRLVVRDALDARLLLADLRLKVAYRAAAVQNAIQRLPNRLAQLLVLRQYPNRVLVFLKQGNRFLHRALLDDAQGGGLARLHLDGEPIEVGVRSNLAGSASSQPSW